MSRTPKMSKHGEMAERDPREAVDERRRMGTPLIVQRNGRIVRIDPGKIAPVERRKTTR